MRYILGFILTSLIIGCTNVKTVYYDSGEIKSKAQYKGNMIDGYYYQYFKNGLKSVSALYKQGQLNGLRTDYYESGKVLSEAFYVNGLIEGDYKEYYDNGKLLMYSKVKHDTSTYYIKYDSLGFAIEDYSSSLMISETSKINPEMILKTKRDYFKIGTEDTIIVKLHDFPSSRILVSVNNGLIKKTPYLYEYIVKPAKVGLIEINYFLRTDSGVRNIGLIKKDVK